MNTATYTLKLKTRESTSTQTGTLQSPAQYGVVCCALAGQLSDDPALLKAAPQMLELLKDIVRVAYDPSPNPPDYRGLFALTAEAILTDIGVTIE